MGAVAAVGVATVAADSSATGTASGAAAITPGTAVASGSICTGTAAGVSTVGVPTVSANGIAVSVIRCISYEGLCRALTAGAAVAGWMWPSA